MPITAPSVFREPEGGMSFRKDTIGDVQWVTSLEASQL